MNTEINSWLEKFVDFLGNLKVEDEDPCDEFDWR